MTTDVKTITVIGLGYVGLPLAVEFCKSRPVTGFDIKVVLEKSQLVGIDPWESLMQESAEFSRLANITTDAAMRS